MYMKDANVIPQGAPAPGGPGAEPKWTRSAKDAVGTAYSTASRIWYTFSDGVVNEVYYPTIDRPQIRDLQYLVTDGETFFHDERSLRSEVQTLSHHALGLRVINSDPGGRYRIIKEVITNPYQACLLVYTRLEADPHLLARLKLFVLCAPHVEGRGWGNNATVITADGRPILCADRGSDGRAGDRGSSDGAGGGGESGQNHTWLALGASAPFSRTSCGYVGVNDGWTDLADNYKMDWEFGCASDGNIALTGEIDLSQGTEFTLGLALGTTTHNALTTLLQSLGVPFTEHRERFIQQWEAVCAKMLPLEKAAQDGGDLYHRSQALLLAHEDKLYPGASIASMSIPWGDAKSDDDGLGGYHLVWTRDMVQTATGLLAAGYTETALRALIYLAIAQLPDGGFYQNFWVDGEANWRGVQLDEVAFPILLAWRLRTIGALKEFDPYSMVMRAASYLIRKGPATPQERWEENSGYSPSTLASNIAALTCAALFARERGDQTTASYIQEYSDFLECHIEAWTVTDEGTLVPGIKRHYIRIDPVSVDDIHPDEDPNRGIIRIANRPPGEQAEFPAREVVDAGFLELVRYGVRKPGDPLIEGSLRVVDAVLKVDLPQGPCWRRYNHDGYGQRADGGPYEGWGQGRAWPLLTGERGHYELAAGRDVKPFLQALEGFQHATGLLPEQLWDEADRPDQQLYFGRPTGAAMPLVWAHAEYLKLLRSTSDGKVFDLIPEVAERYANNTGNVERKLLEVWKPNRQVQVVKRGWTLRVQAPAPFNLHWTDNNWLDTVETRSTPTALGIEFVDIQTRGDGIERILFTFRWLGSDRWEGKDFEVQVTGASTY
ncbi:MAG TPA: glycoside hydrolase family 15 protein [Chloroflexia bacterium]|nr:glycoside hydrolase family 15 protein [Chloroflexia bacterium]